MLTQHRYSLVIKSDSADSLAAEISKEFLVVLAWVIWNPTSRNIHTRAREIPYLLLSTAFNHMKMTLGSIECSIFPTSRV